MAEKRKVKMSIIKGWTKDVYHYEDDERKIACTMFESMSYVIARLAATLQVMGNEEDKQIITIEVTIK